MRGTLPPAVASDSSAVAWDSGQATLFDFAFPASNATPGALMLVIFTTGAGPCGDGFEAAWGPGARWVGACIRCNCSGHARCMPEMQWACISLGPELVTRYSCVCCLSFRDV